MVGVSHPTRPRLWQSITLARYRFVRLVGEREVRDIANVFAAECLGGEVPLEQVREPFGRGGSGIVVRTRRRRR